MPHSSLALEAREKGERTQWRKVLWVENVKRASIKQVDSVGRHFTSSKSEPGFSQRDVRATLFQVAGGLAGR